MTRLGLVVILTGRWSWFVRVVFYGVWIQLSGSCWVSPAIFCVRSKALNFILWKGKAILILQRLPSENLEVYMGNFGRGTKARTRGNRDHGFRGFREIPDLRSMEYYDHDPSLPLSTPHPAKKGLHGRLVHKVLISHHCGPGLIPG